MAGVNSLRHRDFRRLLTGRTFGELGNAVAPVALAFAVLDLTGSAADLGIVVGARSVASVLLVLFGGILADRLPRSVILQGTEVAAALTQAAIAISVLCGFASIPLLVVLSMANGALAAISIPAASSLTPQTVPETQLAQANAYLRVGANLGRFTGAALGGVLVASLGPGWAIAVNASLFLCAATNCACVSRASGTASNTTIATPMSSAPRLPACREQTADRVCRQDETPSLPAERAVRGQRAEHLLRADVHLVDDTEQLPMLAAAFVNGVAIELSTVAWDVSLQENIPADRLARVYSYDILGSIVALPAGAIALGPLAARFGTEATLTGGAILITTATVAALLSRDVRTLSRKPVPA
ncbi:MFS transporter [Amycolatopsis sp. GM8]|uniref:MFS transporter n=1 Tax=Amycolatopsis sp. GM8 TaxID=2896530 RepID=UPI001F3DEDF6|nr:MFS transporter [Amycolatopsis sp. GM8]